MLKLIIRGKLIVDCERLFENIMWNRTKDIKETLREASLKTLKRTLSPWTLKRALSLKILKRTLSLGILKRTPSLRILKKTLSMESSLVSGLSLAFVFQKTFFEFLVMVHCRVVNGDKFSYWNFGLTRSHFYAAVLKTEAKVNVKAAM